MRCERIQNGDELGWMLSQYRDGLGDLAVSNS